MRDGFIARNGVASVLTAERKRKAERRAAQGLESRAPEQHRRCAIPRIGHDESRLALVQRTKTFVGGGRGTYDALHSGARFLLASESAWSTPCASKSVA